MRADLTSASGTVWWLENTAPLQFLLMLFARWVNRRQLAVVLRGEGAQIHSG
jgi:hypothetical protein